MSSNPATAPVPPSQAQVDHTTSKLNAAADALKTQQDKNNEATQAHAQANVQRDAQIRNDKLKGIKANATAQKSILQARSETIQIGDMVVVDLEKLGPEQQTHGLVNQTRFLLHAGAHLESGRVSNISTGPSGRVLLVDTPHATLQVPEQLATRADLFNTEG